MRSDRLSEVEPSQLDALVSLADSREAQGRIAEAISLLRESTTKAPSSAPLHGRLADALHAHGDLPGAIEMYRRTVALDPTLTQAWWGLGCALTSLADHAAAADSFGRLVALQPENGLALHNLGRSLFEIGQVDPAIAMFRKSVAHVAPEMQGLPLASIAVAIPGSRAASNRDVLEARRAWATRCLPSVPMDKVFRGRSADPRRPLRLGYISAFFAKRNWMKPVWGLIDHHDHDRFSVHVFSDGPEPDPQHGYHQNPRVVFHNVSELSNVDLAQFIEEQAIDLLVDLNAFSRPDRLPLFAPSRRPCKSPGSTCSLPRA